MWLERLRRLHDAGLVVEEPAGSGLVARAAELLGLDEVWALGGPQAIAALAYGTETIAAVDKVVGPGNAYVNEAKLLVSRDEAVDLPAGEAEVVVLASASAARAFAALGVDLPAVSIGP